MCGQNLFYVGGYEMKSDAFRVHEINFIGVDNSREFKFMHNSPDHRDYKDRDTPITGEEATESRTL